MTFAFSGLARTTTDIRRHCVRPPNVPRSLTAISLSCLSRFASQGVIEVIGSRVAPALNGELAAA